MLDYPRSGFCFLIQVNKMQGRTRLLAITAFFVVILGLRKTSCISPYQASLRLFKFALGKFCPSFYPLGRTLCVQN
jgi:hypothetical protein